MLNINVSTLIFQVINFLILIFLLTRFLFRPLMRLLTERARRVTHALDDAEMREEEAKRAEVEYLRRLEDAKGAAQTARDAMQEEMERSRQEIIGQAKAEMEAIRARAGEEIERERVEAIRRHREEIGSIVTSLSARMLSEVRHGHHDLFFAAFLDRLVELGTDRLRPGGDMERAGVVPVEVISADSLSGADAERLEEVLSSFLGKELRLTSQLDPSLIGGAIVRVGDRLIDGSIRGQLARLREKFVEELAQR